MDLERKHYMAAIKQLAAVTRSGTGKGAARFVRREGRVPGVIYGGGDETGTDLGRLQGTQQAHLRRALPDHDLRARRSKAARSACCRATTSSTSSPTGRCMSISCASRRARACASRVPVHVVNREASPGVKKGGAVNLVLHTLELLAPADDIPESITIDLAGLDFHDSVHISRPQAAGGLPRRRTPRPTRRS